MMTNDLKKKKIFDEGGSTDLKDASLFSEQATGLINPVESKYPWTDTFYRILSGNTWFPEKVDLSSDSIQSLNESEFQAFQSVLCTLTAQDSIQSNILGEPNYNSYFRDFGITLNLSLLQFQEVIHVLTYSKMAMAFIHSSEERKKMFYMWQGNEKYLNKLKLISSAYQRFADNASIENLYFSIISSIALESIVFYSGFFFFYHLAYMNLLPAVSDMIKLIHRDEYVHFLFFTKLLQTIREEHSEELKAIENIEDRSLEIIQNAVRFEKEWMEEFIGNKVRGLTSDKLAKFIEYICEERLKLIGFKSIFGKVSNPMEYLKKVSDVENDETKSKVGFFESNLASYNHPSAISDWDSIKGK